MKYPTIEESRLAELAAEHGLQTLAAREALRVAIENIQLLDKKNLDYGPNNINAYGTIGVVVKMTDKFERLKTFFNKKRRRMVNESILDTFKDISNYGIIAILIERKRWPRE